MRAMVAITALALLLGGCGENAQRREVRDSLIRLQAELDSGITQGVLQSRLTALDAAARAAVLDRAIDDRLAREISETLKLGRTVEEAWRENFICMKDEYIGRYCFQRVLDALVAMGMSDAAAADWRQREDADIAEDKVRVETAIAEIKGNIKQYGYTPAQVEERTKWAQKYEMGSSPMKFTEAYSVALSLLNERIGRTVAAFQH